MLIYVTLPVFPPYDSQNLRYTTYSEVGVSSVLISLMLDVLELRDLENVFSPNFSGMQDYKSSSN